MPRRPAQTAADSLVVQSGRDLERAARALVPEARDPDGKPLMLGPRMYRLRDRLDDDAWAAYQAWARERNAYVHGESEAIADPDAFRQNYEQTLAALTALTEASEPEAEESLTPIVVLVVAVVLGLLYAC